MTDAAFRRAVYAVLLISALLRFGYLLAGDVLPVMWDARRYAAAGLALISYVDKSSAPAPEDEIEDRYRFKYYYDRYLQGEKIEWLSYAPHNLTQAREEIFFSGPLYPLLLSIIFFLSPAADFMVARLMGIVFDLLANLLLVLVGARLVGRKAAVVGGALYALYFPFILTSTMLLLETSTSLLILLAVYLLIRGEETNSLRPVTLAGLVAGGLVLNKPTAMLIGIPLVVGYLLYVGATPGANARMRKVVRFVVLAAGVFVIWLGIASIHYGQLTLRDPEYAGANLRQSSSVAYEGYDLDRVEEGFWQRSVADEITGDPAGYAGLLIKKFDRLWRRPYNDFQKEFLAPKEGVEAFHLGIAVFGLVGLLLLLRQAPRSAAWPLLIAGYYTAVHLIFHSLARYSFQAMPFVMLGAGFFAIAAADALRSLGSSSRWGAFVSVLLLLVGWLFEPKWVDGLLSDGLSAGIVAGVTIGRVACIFAGLLLLVKPIAVHLKIGRVAIAAVVSAALGITMFSNTFSRDSWAEFECRIDTDAVRAGTRIYISRREPVEDDDQIAAVIDLNSGKGRRNTFSVKINDREFEFVGARPPLVDQFDGKDVYRHYADIVPMGMEEYRQYAIIPLPDSILDAMLHTGGYIDISVARNARFAEPNNVITLRGRHEAGGEVHYVPAWETTAIERFVHQGDPRIPLSVKYLSDSTISYYIPRTAFADRSSEDLSPARGRQTGRYNIFLMQLKADGRMLVY